MRLPVPLSRYGSPHCLLACSAQPSLPPSLLLPQVEQAKFEELEEVYAELKLKQLLWDAIDEWDSLFASWVEADFATLDPEELNAHTVRYGKSVNQLEKGLPPNPVVPKLKERVESMRDKLPVITNLRNPTLKNRHWDSIEDVSTAQYRALNNNPVRTQLNSSSCEMTNKMATN